MSIPSKPQPYYARFNQPPRSPNGKNRRTAPANHSDPLDGADSGPGGSDPTRVHTTLPAISWRTINLPVDPFPPAGGGALTGAQLMQQMIDDIHKRMFATMFYGNPPSPPTIPHIGIRSGEIIGHRGWIVAATPTGPMLRSLAHHFLWTPGETITGDINEQVSRGPIHNIFGGVYAFREFAGLHDDIAAAESEPNWPIRFLSPITSLGFAYGTVKLWGETVEHEKGYRASFAKLISIDDFIGVEGFDLDALRKRYHV